MNSQEDLGFAPLFSITLYDTQIVEQIALI